MVELKQFPNGCRDCGGACCRVYDGNPPYEIKHSDSVIPCRELTEDGLCGIWLRNGFDAIPKVCRVQQVGDPECLSGRREAGLQ